MRLPTQPKEERIAIYTESIRKISPRTTQRTAQ